MMSLRLAPPLQLLFLLVLISRVGSQEWSMHYRSKSICALKGSTVTMSCNYTYPAAYKVERAFWSRQLAIENEPPDLSLDPKYQSRVQYLGDRLGNCGLRLSGVTEQDQGKYYFRFITTPAEKYQGKDGVHLSVTELQVVIPDTVVEGKAVTLTCKTGNRISSNSTFIWNKNGSRLPSSTNLLHLPSVSRRDVGRYSCAVQKLQSCEVTLRLQYVPKNVLVSISPSGEIVEGSSVTLTCSSDANPPVELYTWYKVNESSPVGSGQSYSFTLSSNSSGWFYCVAQNKYGTQRAAAVPLTLNGNQNVVLYIAVGIAGGCGCLFLIIGVLCIRKKRRGGSKDAAKSFWNVESRPPDDTYTALDLPTRFCNDSYHTRANADSSPPDDKYAAPDLPARSSNNSYHTRANLHSSSIDDTYTALDLQTMSSNDIYHTLGSVHPNPPDEVYTSLDFQFISSDYLNIPIGGNQH